MQQRYPSNNPSKEQLIEFISENLRPISHLFGPSFNDICEHLSTIYYQIFDVSDKKARNTYQHYASESGMQTYTELLDRSGGSIQLNSQRPMLSTFNVFDHLLKTQTLDIENLESWSAMKALTLSEAILSFPVQSHLPTIKEAFIRQGFPKEKYTPALHLIETMETKYRECIEKGPAKKVLEANQALVAVLSPLVSQATTLKDVDSIPGITTQQARPINPRLMDLLDNAYPHMNKKNAALLLTTLSLFSFNNNTCERLVRLAAIFTASKLILGVYQEHHKNKGLPSVTNHPF